MHGQSVRHCLMRLLMARPNEWVTVSEVVDACGRKVSREAVHNAVELVRDKGVLVVSRHGRRGGYMLPVAERDGSQDDCAVCAHRSDGVVWSCRMLLCPVKAGMRCGMWKAREERDG